MSRIFSLTPVALATRDVVNPATRPWPLALVLLLAAAAWSGDAQAQLTLAQVPAGSGGKEPAPNVIISVDDSGSMNWDLDGCLSASSDSSSTVNYHDNPSWCRSKYEYKYGTYRGTSNLPTRMAQLSAALVTTFGNGSSTKGIIEDNQIRLAWQSMHNNGGGGPTLTGSSTGNNSMKPFTGTHRSNFYNFATGLRPNGGTPTHSMMRGAYNYLKWSSLNASSPWASEPGKTAAPFLECRRAFHVVMTDGGWDNADSTAANADGASGVPYPYKDNVSNTIADWAYKSWVEDLQPSIPNGVRELLRVTENETYGSATLTPYWNPKNNPAKHQHISTYTIGFGVDATSWTGGPAWPADDNMYGGDYSKLVQGTVKWESYDTGTGDKDKKPADLYHAALNGRGKYFPARDGTALTKAFESILAEIISISSSSYVSIGASSSTLRTNSDVFLAGYDSKKWSGFLEARDVSSGGTVAAGAKWKISTWLDNPANLTARKIFTHNGSAGVEFVWGNLGTTLQGLLNKDRLGTTDNRGQDRVAYLRGDRSKEGVLPSNFRMRESLLGDIVNSKIWHTGAPPGGTREPVLYVGANDGMLHGFSAKDGREVMAYVPRGVYQRLTDLTSTTYDHRYYVDGSPFTGEIGTGSTPKTMLVGTLGAGGKGFFVLDVTAPGSFGASQVVMDKTDGSDPDLGHIVAHPVVSDVDGLTSTQIVKTNNGKWSAILGNGVNSTNAQPVLLVQDLSSATGLTKVIATGSGVAGAGNGLSAPKLIDLDGNGTVDLAYAGDNKGNMWRFNLTGASGWKAELIYSAKDASGNAQPIVGAPMWKPHPLGGIMLAFGTGRNVDVSDVTSTATQTIYGIWDTSAVLEGGSLKAAGPVFNGRTGKSANPDKDGNSLDILQKQMQGAKRTEDGQDYWEVSKNPVDYGTLDKPVQRGWYLDLPNAGERVIHNARPFFGSQILILSTVPRSGSIKDETESCAASSEGEKTYLTIVDVFAGTPPGTDVFDVLTPSETVNVIGRTQVLGGDILVLGQGDTTHILSTGGMKDPTPQPSERLRNPLRDVIRNSFSEF